MKIKYTKWPVENPKTKKRTYIFVPIIEILLVGNHKVGKTIRSYLDTGAMFNVFPEEYALTFLGYSKKSLEKGDPLEILGVGGIKTKGFGHECSIQHPEFSIKDIMIYFVEDQPYPLLGRTGFMDHFKKIIFNEESKVLEITV